MIRGMKKSVQNAQQINKTIEASIHNRFDIEVIDSVTGEIKQRAQGLNTICNQLWTRMFTPASYFSCIHYGNGSGTPSASDTSLFGYISYGSISTPKLDASRRLEGVYSIKGEIQLLPSVAVGETITEVGIAYSSTDGTLCTHSMLEDMNGNPISIQKTDTDVINIYATVYLHFNPRGYDNGSIRIVERQWNYYYSGNLKYERGFIPYLLGVYSAEYLLNVWVALGGWDYQNSRNSHSGLRSGNSLTFDAANKTINIKSTRMDIGYSNVNGIVEITLCAKYGSSDYGRLTYPSIILSPGGDWFPYSEIVSEAVGTGDGVTTDFALDFSLARNATIYVDGVPVEASVDYSMNMTGDNIRDAAMWLEEGSTEDNLIRNVYVYSVNGYYSGDSNLKMFKNMAYQIGIRTVYCYGTAPLYCSNDLITWIEVAPEGGTVQIPEEYQHYKYWKCQYGFNWISGIASLTSKYEGKVVHLATPPAEGAVITADYISDTIAKDENHVFDLSLTIQLGEYTE